MPIDLNADLGEGCGLDAELMPLISSANVACGFHAGDPATALQTLQLAAQYHVHVGAHPGFADREHFGRRELQRSEQQVFEECVYQVGALAALARAAGIQLSHIKAHGALYNLACRDEAYARPMIAVAEFFTLPLLGLPGSRLQVLSQGRCRFVAEGFADRRYCPDGALVPRSKADAFIESPTEAVEQALWLVRERNVETLCVHGDNPQAVEFVRQLRSHLERQGLEVRPIA
jgi:UPF0271 protein